MWRYILFIFYTWVGCSIFFLQNKLYDLNCAKYPSDKKAVAAIDCSMPLST